MAELHPIPTHGLFQNLTGRRFGRLTVGHYAGRRGSHHNHSWECLCDCGGTTIAFTSNLNEGHTTSCGCAKAENLNRGLRLSHGCSYKGKWSPEYSVWAGMIQRCANASSPNFPRYGGRGIRICERWRDSFENFLADMGPRPSAHTIDRIDNDGNYEPGNCVWSTAKRQARNRRTNRLLTFNGLSLCVAEWSERLGWPQHVIRNRLRYGWPVARALGEPYQPTSKPQGIRS